MYLLFEVFDKWEDAYAVGDHCQRVPLRRALPTVHKSSRPIPVPPNKQWPVTIVVKDKANSGRP